MPALCIIGYMHFSLHQKLCLPSCHCECNCAAHEELYLLLCRNKAMHTTNTSKTVKISQAWNFAVDSSNCPRDSCGNNILISRRNPLHRQHCQSKGSRVHTSILAMVVYIGNGILLGKLLYIYVIQILQNRPDLNWYYSQHRYDTLCIYDQHQLFTWPAGKTDWQTSHSCRFAHTFHHLVIALTTQIQNVSKLTNQLLITAYMLLLEAETPEFKHA